MPITSGLTWRKAFVILFGGLGLAVTSCFGFAVAMDLSGSPETRDNIGNVAITIFFSGLAIAAVGLLLLIYRAFAALFTRPSNR